MNIAILCKENYLKAAETLVASLARQTTEKLDVYLLYNDIREQKVEKFRKFVAHKCHGILQEIKVDATVFTDMPLNTHFTMETYFRLLMPALLPKEIDKILYLDVDMIIRYSLDDLYQMEMGDCYAVVCPSRWEPMRLEKEKLPLSSSHIYFNAGVMLYNMKKIREENDELFLIRCMYKHKEKLRYLDQDVLNIAFCDRVKYVDYHIYDMQIVAGEKFMTRELKDIRRQAAVIHYLGDVKPWDREHYYRNPLKREYFKAVLKKGNILESMDILIRRPVWIIFHEVKRAIQRKMRHQNEI